MKAKIKSWCLFAFIVWIPVEIATDILSHFYNLYGHNFWFNVISIPLYVGIAIGETLRYSR
jgi:hypothetical protein